MIRRALSVCVDDLLPVSLAGGINVLESGQTWLAKHLTGHRVWFKPLRITNDDRLECIVHTRMVLLPVFYCTVCMSVCVPGPVRSFFHWLLPCSFFTYQCQWDCSKHCGTIFESCWRGKHPKDKNTEGCNFQLVL